MNVSNLYRKLKQILNDSNTALVSKGLNKVVALNDISSEVDRLEINRLPYLFRKEIIVIAEEDLSDCTQIRNYAIQNNTNLINVDIPDSVTAIGREAFRGCKNLKNITIPASVTDIGHWTFFNSGLEHVYLHSTTPPTITNSVWSHRISTIHVPIGSGDIYKSATNWSQYADKIVEDIII